MRILWVIVEVEPGKTLEQAEREARHIANTTNARVLFDWNDHPIVIDQTTKPGWVAAEAGAAIMVARRRAILKATRELGL